MDEPLSNLDAKLRGDTRRQIVQLPRPLGVTTLYVTHDQVEAMTMGHRIAVLNAGRLQQLGTPIELYEQPANLFVASLFLASFGMLASASLQTSQASATGEAGTSFANMLKSLAQDVSVKSAQAGEAVQGVLAGEGVPLHQAVIAAEEASVSFQLMVEVRNKLLESYQELMRMQV